MKKAFEILIDYMSKIYDEIFCIEGTRCISYELKQILKNECDKEKYLNAIDEVRKTGKGQKVELSNGCLLIIGA